MYNHHTRTYEYIGASENQFQVPLLQLYLLIPKDKQATRNIASRLNGEIKKEKNKIWNRMVNNKNAQSYNILSSVFDMRFGEALCILLSNENLINKDIEKISGCYHRAKFAFSRHNLVKANIIASRLQICIALAGTRGSMTQKTNF